jgi:hypothetical protein
VTELLLEGAWHRPAAMAGVAGEPNGRVRPLADFDQARQALVVEMPGHLEHEAGFLLHHLLIRLEVELGEGLPLLTHVAIPAPDAQPHGKATHDAHQLWFLDLLGEHLKIVELIGNLCGTHPWQPGAEHDEQAKGGDQTTAIDSYERA